MKPYDIRNFLNVLILCLLLGWVAALLFGCTTTTQSILTTEPPITRCHETRLISLSAENWTDADEWNMDLATKGCARKYKDNPCLTQFERVEQLKYRATCGPKH